MRVRVRDRDKSIINIANGCQPYNNLHQQPKKIHKYQLYILAQLFGKDLRVLQRSYRRGGDDADDDDVFQNSPRNETKWTGPPKNNPTKIFNATVMGQPTTDKK